MALYTLDTGEKILRNGTIKRYYNCHRSFIFKSKSKNVRAVKSMGSNKINKCCPSRLVIEIHPIANVTVKFWKTHHGHTAQIGRITLDKITKTEIAGNN